MLDKTNDFCNAIKNALKEDKEVYVGMKNTVNYRLENLIKINDNILEFTSTNKHYVVSTDEIMGIFAMEKSKYQKK